MRNSEESPPLLIILFQSYYGAILPTMSVKLPTMSVFKARPRPLSYVPTVQPPPRGAFAGRQESGGLLDRSALKQESAT